MGYFFAIYFLIVNAAGLILMMTDKIKAKANMWRVRESTFFGIALIGGTVGVLAGMYLFHHKTRHAKFIFGIPLILLLQFLAYLEFFA